MSTRIYYTVYKTTNLLNGKYYIGKHKTTTPNDYYLGSGLALKNAVKKYGKDQFVKKVICICETDEYAYLIESKLVTKLIIKDENCYNIVCGGGGLYNSEKAHQTRIEKYNGKYFSEDGTKSMKSFTSAYTKANNPMHKLIVQKKYYDSIAQKIGYSDHQEYVMAVKQAFEQCKTIKTTSDFTGHPQQTILHLLLKHFGKDYIDDIRKEGFKEARQRQTNNFILSQFCRSKKDGKLNHNAYIWLGKSPENNIFIIFGKRIQFCRDKHFAGPN